MKKITAMLLALIMVFGINTIAFANDDIKIRVNGEYLADAQAVLVDGSTLLPVRSVGTAVGGTVDWNNDTKTAFIIKGDKRVSITIGQKEISVNGVKQPISVPAQIIDGRTYVPLRALGEALNCYVEWIGDIKTVDILELANDPSEYRAWYEVDHKGRLFLKTNIDSRDWNGYSLRLYKEYKDNSYGHDGQGGYGDVVLYTSTSSTSWQTPGNVLEKTTVYVFKGSRTHMEVWNNIDNSNSRSQNTLEKASEAFGDKFVAKLVIDTDIATEKLDKKIILTDFGISYNEDGSRETYTAKIEGPIEEKGEYGLVCSYNGNTNAVNKASHMYKGDGVLTFTRDAGHFSRYGEIKSGYFRITYGTHYVKPDGTIVCAKTESNGIPYTFE